MTSPGMLIRHAKARGEWAELRFMTRATELGFRVAKPWGDCAPYDVATDHRGHFCRVQVKCTIQKRWNSYRCGLAANGVPYTTSLSHAWQSATVEFDRVGRTCSALAEEALR